MQQRYDITPKSQHKSAIKGIASPHHLWTPPWAARGLSGLVQSSWKQGRAVTCKEPYTRFEEACYGQEYEASHSMWGLAFSTTCPATGLCHQNLRNMQKKGNKGRKKQNYPLVENKKKVHEETKRRVTWVVHWTRGEHVPISTEVFCDFSGLWSKPYMSHNANAIIQNINTHFK